MAKQFFCTRPTLAALLREKGQEGTQTINPFRDGAMAWTFPINPSLVQIVTEYYQDRGLPVPGSISGGDQA